MSYSDFKTLEQVNKDLGIVIKAENELYINVEPVKVTQWFIDTNNNWGQSKINNL